MNVPVDVSNVRSFAVVRLADTSHLAGTVGVADGACCARRETVAKSVSRMAQTVRVIVKAETGADSNRDELPDLKGRVAKGVHKARCGGP
jgi:hypothetical protein